MECHEEVVAELIARGETIYKPTPRKSFLTKYHRYPDIYLKSMPFPSKEFRAGSGMKGKDGTYTIIGEHFTWFITGLKIEELGLCDPVVGYANCDLLREIEERKIPRCPTCGRVL
jgi:hypothetical protein